MNNINWTKWSSIAEIISSLAILVTLVYLAIQTSQNEKSLAEQNLQTRLAMSREALAVFNDWRDVVASDEQLSAIYYKGSRGEELTDLEYARFGMLCTNLLQSLVLNIDFATTLGIQDAADGFVTEIKNLLDNFPGVETCWNERVKPRMEFYTNVRYILDQI